MSRKFSHRRSSSFFLVALATATTTIAALTGRRRPRPLRLRLVRWREGVRAKVMIRVVDGLVAATTYTVTISAVTAGGPGAPATVSVPTPAA
jgi:hypothetical protein